MNHHYYVTFALGWATAPTLEEAIKKLARGFERDIKPALKKLQKDNLPGLYLWSCRVHAPADARYSIEFYKPVDVEISERRHLCLVKLTKKQVLWAEMPEEFL
jgi:hypothetical protein